MHHLDHLDPIYGVRDRGGDGLLVSCSVPLFLCIVGCPWPQPKTVAAYLVCTLRLLRYAFYPLLPSRKASCIHTCFIRLSSLPDRNFFEACLYSFLGLLKMGEPSLVQVPGAWLLLWLQSLSLFAHAWRFYEHTLPSLSCHSFSSGGLFIDFSELNSGNASVIIHHVLLCPSAASVKLFSCTLPIAQSASYLHWRS